MKAGWGLFMYELENMKEYYRVYAEIDLDVFEQNLDAIEEKLCPGARILAVVKADGYGHGARELCTEVLEGRDRVAGYATASLEEAMSLQAQVKKPILILGYTFPDQYPILAKTGIRPTLFDYDSAREMSRAALAQGPGHVIPVHIKLDTGMGRIGYQINEEAADEIAKIADLAGIRIEGIYTHFARADERDPSAARRQMEAYGKMMDLLAERGVKIPCHHMANSAGILCLPESHADLARAGIILYGLSPSAEVNVQDTGIRPILSLKSRVTHVKTLPAGSPISYGGTYVLDQEAQIATVPVGYGDGYPRSLSNLGYVLIHGQKAPIRGRVCMDQFMVDVSHIPNVKRGDMVTLIGRDGQAFVGMDELGGMCGRFNYELACDLGKRIPRNYLRGGTIISQRDYFNV